MERDNLEMILEDMSGKFDLVLEGQESLRQEMHSIRDDLAEKIPVQIALAALAQSATGGAHDTTQIAGISGFQVHPIRISPGSRMVRPIVGIAPGHARQVTCPLIVAVQPAAYSIDQLHFCTSSS